jgi:hypothetical protein
MGITSHSRTRQCLVSANIRDSVAYWFRAGGGYRVAVIDSRPCHLIWSGNGGAIGSTPLAESGAAQLMMAVADNHDLSKLPVLLLWPPGFPTFFSLNVITHLYVSYPSNAAVRPVDLQHCYCIDGAVALCRHLSAAAHPSTVPSPVSSALASWPWDRVRLHSFNEVTGRRLHPLRHAAEQGKAEQ